MRRNPIINFLIKGAAAGVLLATAQTSFAMCTAGDVTIVGKPILPVLSTQIGSKGNLNPTRVCEWKVKRHANAANCNGNRVIVAGTGTKPSGTIKIKRKKDNTEVPNRSISGSNNNWSWTGNNLNCSTTGCSYSQHIVSTEEPQGSAVCSQDISMTIRLL